MKRFSKLLLLAGFLFLLISCDYYHEQHFYVVNQLDTTIQFHYDVAQVTDSIVEIKAHGAKEIYTYGGVFGSVGVNDERYNDGLQNLRVQLNDTLIELNESLWIFLKETKYHGNSFLKIDSAVIR
mgnify:CR=1 FL=1